MGDSSEHWTIDADPISPSQVLIQAATSRSTSESRYISRNLMKSLLEEQEGDRRNLEDRLDDLPIRLYRLIYDVAALDAGGNLNNIDQNWERMLDLPDYMHWSVRKLHGRETYSSFDTPEFDLGFDVGLTLSTLTGLTDEDYRGLEFLTGFIEAYSTSRYEKGLIRPSTEPVHRKINQERAEVLERYGIKPTYYIDRVIEIFLQGKRATESNSFPSDEKEGTQKYIEEYLPDDFGKYSTLRAKVEEEWDAINAASVPGIDAKDAVRALWELDTPQKTSSQEVSEKLGEGYYKGSVTQIFNRLSENGKNPSDQVIRIYKNNEIIRYTKEGWEFTKYGKLLCYHVFAHNKDCTWMHRVALDIQLFTDETKGYSKKASDILEDAVIEFYNTE